MVVTVFDKSMELLTDSRPGGMYGASREPLDLNPTAGIRMR